ncbi:rhomboid family intramembrane serine protease [Macrococcus carouselicus]|uniref:Rhomboid family intramembrane serine protease n=1 Tax=Macrococcus carouselicus TaxID=69969 RepID=A0A9Q8CJW7_9STAP|nr:rhomboid family intramembrane serine protease [Macrococcus carouselicus]TDM04349.1 rhomboid family intramembrane serine protease [Macrococcus carouselicus]
MITSKQLWEAIYKISMYSHFELIQSQEFMMASVQERRIIRFVTEKQNVQSLDFLVQKIEDNIVQQVDFKPQQIEIYLLNQPVPGDINDRSVKVKSLNDRNDFNTLSISRQYQILGKRRLKHSENFYQKRLMTSNSIDRAMISFAPVTSLLILINVVLYVINRMMHFNTATADFIEAGGLSHFNFVHGEYFRLISSIFLHFDFSHLLLNMLSLYIFGKLVEYFYGPVRFFLIYFLSGLMGNLLSLSFETSALSVGASGAISGLLGALLAYMVTSRRFDRKMVLQTAGGLILFFLLSNLFGRVNNWAHFGGLFSGFYIALLLYCYKYALKYFFLLLAGLVLMTVLLLMNIFSVKEEHIYNDRARISMQKGDFEEAEQVMKQTFAKEFENDESYQLYGLILTHEQSLAEGIATWKKGLKRYPDSSLLNYQMALAMRANDDYMSAEKYLTKSGRYMNKQEMKDLKKEIKVFGE